MHLPANRRRHAVVVGLGNPEIGGGLISAMISSDRADIVAVYLLEHGVTGRSATGLGTAQPLAAPAQHGARFRNERIEVWML